MLLLKTLQFALGAFVVVFLIWQVIVPLLCNKRPFPAFREKSNSNKGKK